MANNVADLVFETAQRNLDRQERNLDTLRIKATAVLSASAVIAGLLGGRAFDLAHHLGLGGWVALVAFGLGALLIVVVVMPRSFAFSGDALATYIEWAEAATGTDQLVADLPGAELAWAKAYRDCITRNEGAIDCLTWLFTAACLLLIPVQGVAWVLQLYLHHS